MAVYTVLQQKGAEAANAMSEAPVLLHVDFLMAVSGAEVVGDEGEKGAGGFADKFLLL